MSTILDALRKLQRERAAQTPAKDLRGSITHESSRTRRRGSGARNLGLGLALLALAGGGYALYRGGQLQGLLARFSSDEEMPSEEDFAAIEREMAEREAAARAAGAGTETPPVADSPPAPAPVARLPRNAPPQPNVAGAPGESPEILAERARLEAALANARAAQEAQQQAARDAQAAQQAAANPPPPEAATPPAPAPAPATHKRVVAKRPVMPGEPAAAAKPQAQPTPQAKPQPKPEPKPAAEEIEARAVPRAADEPAPARAAFPEVWVESIRWHPIAERRVASLRFERQNAPEAREGDIVAGVLVYRIDPGSVELRVGSAQRTVSPGP